MSNFKQMKMKTLNIKNLIIIAFLAIFMTSCTELYSEDDQMLDNNNIENVQAVENECGTKNC